MTDTRWDDVIGAYLDGSIAVDEAQALNEALVRDRSLAARFVLLSRLDDRLRFIQADIKAAGGMDRAVVKTSNAHVWLPSGHRPSQQRGPGRPVSGSRASRPASRSWLSLTSSFIVLLVLTALVLNRPAPEVHRVEGQADEQIGQHVENVLPVQHEPYVDPTPELPPLLGVGLVPALHVHEQSKSSLWSHFRPSASSFISRGYGLREPKIEQTSGAEGAADTPRKRRLRYLHIRLSITIRRNKSPDPEPDLYDDLESVQPDDIEDEQFFLAGPRLLHVD